MAYKLNIYDSVLNQIEKEDHLVAGVYFARGSSFHIIIRKRSQEKICHLSKNRRVWAVIKRSNGEEKITRDCSELKEILDKFQIEDIKYCCCLD